MNSIDYIVRKTRKALFLKDLMKVLDDHKAEIVTEIESISGDLNEVMVTYFDLNQCEYAQYDQEFDTGYAETRIDVNVIKKILERLEDTQ